VREKEKTHSFPKTFIRRMKKNFLFLCLASLLSGSAAFAQTTVTTDPVGFITETVTHGSLATPSINLVSPTLTNPIAFQGTIATISSTTITITGASFTANQFNGANGSYYVEVFSATKPGALSDITATGSNSVTTHDNLTAFASAGDSVRIRQHITLNQFLGANNTFGLLGSNSDATTADDILVFDGATQNTYWYYTGTPPSLSDAGWYDLIGNPAGSIALPPGAAFIVNRIEGGAFNWTLPAPSSF
jgi:hypothetical protein